MASSGAVAEREGPALALSDSVLGENPASLREDGSSLIFSSDIERLVKLGLSVREAVAEGNDLSRAFTGSGLKLERSYREGNAISYLLRGLTDGEYKLLVREVGLPNGRRDADVQIIFDIGYTIRSSHGRNSEDCDCRGKQGDPITRTWQGIADVITHLVHHEIPFAEAVPYLMALSEREGLQRWAPLEGHFTKSEATFEYQPERRQEGPSFFIGYYGASFAEIVANPEFHTSDRGAQGGITSPMQETLQALRPSAAVDVALSTVSTFLTITTFKANYSQESVELEIALQIPFKDEATAQIYRRNPGGSLATDGSGYRNGNGHHVSLPTNGAAHHAAVL